MLAFIIAALLADLRARLRVLAPNEKEMTLLTCFPRGSASLQRRPRSRTEVADAYVSCAACLFAVVPVSPRYLLMVMLAVLLAACSRTPKHRADWVIASQVVFLSADLRHERKAPPANEMRLWFPYVSGDIYGAPTTGSFYDVVLKPDHSFVLDLNAPHGNVLKSLERSAFSMRELAIAPAEARIARLLPFVLQADGIERLGQADWVDADTHRRLMLVYFDRKARIAGSRQGAKRTFLYDIWTEEPGYVWVSQSDSGDTSEWTRARPARVLLAVTPVGR